MHQAARNSGWTPRHSSHPYWASPARTLGDIQSPSKPWLRNALTAVHPQPSPHPTGLDPDSHWPLSPTQPLLLGPSPLTARISPVAAPGTGARPRTASLRSRSGLEQAGQHPEVLSVKGGELGRAGAAAEDMRSGGGWPEETVRPRLNRSTQARSKGPRLQRARGRWGRRVCATRTACSGHRTTEFTPMTKITRKNEKYLNGNRKLFRTK